VRPIPDTVVLMTNSREENLVTAEGTSRFVQTKEWNLHYNEVGADSGGQAVIMLHGSGPGATGWSNFKSNLPALGEHFHTFAIDMPGWGRSDPAPVGRRDHVAAVIQFMDALGIEKAAFIGNSMGGITTLSVAVEHPERVSHIITMGPGSGLQPRLFSPGDGLSEGMKVLVEAYRNPTAETMKRLVEVMTYDSARFGTDELAQERADATLANPEHVRNYLDAFAKGRMIEKWFRLEDLTKLEQPALLVHGRDDRVVHYEHSLVLLSHIPNSRLVLFNRCGHWAQLEHAEEFNRLVTDFIKSN